MGGIGPVAVWTIGGLVAAGLLWRRPAYRLARLLSGRPDPDRDWTPARRPIEQVAARLRVLGPEHHFPAPGAPHVRRESVRLAYDDCLAEACDALGVPHLLTVVPDGAERDTERARVEVVLMGAGLDLRLPLA